MLKKIVSILLALTLALSVSTWAMATSAADMSGESGKIGEFQSADTPDSAKADAVIIYKTIKAYNQTSTKVNAPTITYEYTIAPGTAGATVKDSDDTSIHANGNAVEVQVKAGPTGAKISGSPDGNTYTEGELALTPTVELDASAAGADNKYPLKVDLSGVTWSGAGVYRYVITESTTESAKNLAGIAEGDDTADNIRYLDVYVKDGTTAGTYDIYGYVLFSELGNITAEDEDDAGKTEGFEADDYYTFDLTISKELKGDNANNSHQFPFNVDFTNNSVTAVIGLKQTTVEGGGITANLPANAAVSSLDVADLGLANGASVTYIGIPVGITAATTVAVYETNDVTGTVYGSTYKIDDVAPDGNYKQLTWVSDNDANKSNTATLSGLTMNAHDSKSKHTIAFTNTLELISPTGVVLRIAPYALIMIAGIALFLISRRRKTTKEEE